MPIVTFWSNTRKTTGQTIGVSSIATAMAMDYSYKILLISADVNDNQMEKNFGIQQNNEGLLKSLMTSAPKMDLDSGIDGLLRLARTNRLAPELIKDYAKVIINNRLDVLYSPNLVGNDINEMLSCLKKIIMNAARYYDYVFVDLKKGINLPIIWEILDVSDIVIYNTSQTNEQMRNFIKYPKFQNMVENNKIIWLINKYDSDSKYDAKHIAKDIWKKDIIYTIQYNTALFEATQEGRLANFLLDIRSSKGKNKNSYILEEIRIIIKHIINLFNEIQRNR